MSINAASASSPPGARRPPATSILYSMALGTFAIGTQGFMIAPLLPNLAQDLSVSLVAAGQLVTVFTLAYAVSSPILTALTGGLGRRNLLIFAMTGFVLGNVIAALATSYWMLMAARIFLAFAAGLYVPNANALATSVVAPEKRGTALSIITGGTSMAVTLGVPLSAFIGHGFGWRMTFVVVGTLAIVAMAGLRFGLHRDVGAGLPVASLRARLALVGQKPVLLTLFVTLLWATGVYTVYTYLAVFVAREAGIDGEHVGLVLFTWGVSAAIGVTTGGRLNDRLGSKAVMLAALALLAASFVTMSLSACLLAPAAARVPVLLAIVVWGLAAWAYIPAQQARLIDVAGVKVASVVLSLNSSFMFTGFALGAALGSVTIAYSSPAALGFVGAASIVTGLIVVFAITRQQGVRPASWCRAEAIEKDR